MSGNSIGKLFSVTTAGESHGAALVAIVDGCPPGMGLSEADLQGDLDRRTPGQARHTTQRKESDEVKIQATPNPAIKECPTRMSGLSSKAAPFRLS